MAVALWGTLPAYPAGAAARPPSHRVTTHATHAVRSGKRRVQHIVSHGRRRVGRPRAGHLALASWRRPVASTVRTLTVVATAYWPDPRWSSGYTATGMRAQYGVVAVDPSVIPLGSRLYVPGYGEAVAADTGSAIVGDRIDVCFDSPGPAEAWGVRTVTIDIQWEP
jgi:3D (Asp-Asp-Asp) domain-containing protein